MASANTTVVLATEEDAPALASIMTAAFSACDAAYPLIWTAQAPEGVHDVVAVKGLFTPLQREGRVTFKAMDGEKVMGFATWSLPEVKAQKRGEQAKVEGETQKSSGLPEMSGVNSTLWREKLGGPKEAYERDVEPYKDMSLSFFFVHPDHQRRGIGTMLLQWGFARADETKSKVWLTSTPQAVRAYEKSGWEVVQRYDLDLEKYGGVGIYSRAWMVRFPREVGV